MKMSAELLFLIVLQPRLNLWIEGREGFRAGMNDMVENTSLVSAGKRSPILQSSSLQSSHYTDWAVLDPGFVHTTQKFHFRRICKIAKSEYLSLSYQPVCPSVSQSFRMEQLGSNWTDFHEIWYLSTFLKSIKKIRSALYRGVRWRRKRNVWLWTFESLMRGGSVVKQHSLVKKMLYSNN